MNEKEMNNPLLTSSEHPDDALLLNYVEGDASPALIEQIEAHLRRCAVCFQTAATYHRQETDIAYENDLQEEQEQIEIDIDAQVEKIFSKQSAKLGVAALLLAFFVRRRFLAISGGVLLSAFLLFFIGLPQYRIMQSDKLVSKGKAFLLEEYAISSLDMPRPSGGFDHSLLTVSRGEAREILTGAANDLEKAIEHNDKNARAYQYLATWQLFTGGDLSEARANYAKALGLDSLNANIWNDLGVVAFHRGDYYDAQAKFEKALSLDPRQDEAKYNLALTYETMAKHDEAVRIWEEYVQVSSDSQWINVARENLKRLSGENERR